MAGCALRPPFVSFCGLLQRTTFSEAERGFVSEFVEGIHPINWLLIVRNSGLTNYEVAQALIECGVDRASPAGFVVPQHLPDEPIPLRVRARMYHHDRCGEWPGGLTTLYALQNSPV